MGESARGPQIRNDGISPAAPPRFHRRAVPVGFDHGGFSDSSLRARGPAFTNLRMRLHMRGLFQVESSVPLAAGSETDLAGLPREDMVNEYFPAGRPRCRNSESASLFCSLLPPAGWGHPPCTLGRTCHDPKAASRNETEKENYNEIILVA